MADNSDVDQFVKGEIEDISRAEAIADRTKGRYAFTLESSNNFIDRGACLGSAMITYPCV